MTDKKFLEEYPLYRRFETDLYFWTRFLDLPKPAIHMHCETCGSDHTFNMVNEYHEVDFTFGANILEALGTPLRAKYRCSSCQSFERTFFLKFEKQTKKMSTENGEETEQEVVSVTKVGQEPAWDIAMDRELEKSLAQYAQYYKRGLITESQSYGIAAHAYYRRITETIIDDLLIAIPELMSGEERDKYQNALGEVKKTRVTQEKIELVKDLLPTALRPDGLNPLGVLHAALSMGLHEETDEACLEAAENIRKVLVFLVNQVSRTKLASAEFTQSMRNLLEKKIKLGIA